jgi:hypothetical protein
LWGGGARKGSRRKAANDLSIEASKNSKYKMLASKPNCWNVVCGHSAGGREWKQIALILLLLCMLPCAHPARLSNAKFHSVWSMGKTTCWLHQLCDQFTGLINLGEPIPLIIAYLSLDLKANVFGMHIWYQPNWTIYMFLGSPRPAHVTQALQPNGHVTSPGLWVPEAVGCQTLLV